MATVHRRRRRGPRLTRSPRGTRPQPRSRAVADHHHRGVVTNLTVGKTATLVIRFTRGIGEAITGAVAIGPELSGSGPLRGTITGTTIVFATVGELCSIAWSGAIGEQHIAGVYTVTAPVLPIADQIGVWAVAR